jgi:hypothetical protein
MSDVRHGPLARAAILAAMAVLAAGNGATEETNKLSEPVIDCGFPGGNIARAKIVGEIASLAPDLRDTQGGWFYWCFRVRGAAGRTLRFNGIPIGVRGPAVSLDEGLTWKWLGKDPETGKKTFTYVFPPDAGAVRFSVGMPYVEADWRRFLERIRADDQPALRIGELCKSRKGRSVEKLHAGRLDGEARFRAVVTARHHSCEMMANYAVEGVVEAVLADDDNGRWLREHVELLIVPFADKDGVEDGDQGKNRKPRDHGRDYDDNALYPETATLRAWLPAWIGGRATVAIDLHCPSLSGKTDEHVYQVGKEKPEVWAEQRRFGKVLEGSRQGPLPYETARDLPFGVAWNKGQNYHLGPSFSRWAATIPGMKLATSFEIPYANAAGVEVNDVSARAFGRDLAVAIRRYLEAP